VNSPGLQAAAAAVSTYAPQWCLRCASHPLWFLPGHQLPASHSDCHHCCADSAFARALAAYCQVACWKMCARVRVPPAVPAGAGARLTGPGCRAGRVPGALLEAAAERVQGVHAAVRARSDPAGAPGRTPGATSGILTNTSVRVAVGSTASFAVGNCSRGSLCSASLALLERCSQPCAEPADTNLVGCGVSGARRGRCGQRRATSPTPPTSTSSHLRSWAQCPPRWTARAACSRRARPLPDPRREQRARNETLL